MTAVMNRRGLTPVPLDPPELKPVAIDGKCPARFGAAHRRSIGPARRQRRSVENHLTLGQAATDAKSNEITAIPELLELLDLEGNPVSVRLFRVIRCRFVFSGKNDEPTPDFPSRFLRDCHFQKIAESFGPWSPCLEVTTIAPLVLSSRWCQTEFLVNVTGLIPRPPCPLTRLPCRGDSTLIKFAGPRLAGPTPRDSYPAAARERTVSTSSARSGSMSDSLTATTERDSPMALKISSTTPGSPPEGWGTTRSDEHGHVPSHEAVIRDVPSQGHPLVQLGLHGRGFLQGFRVTK